MPSLPLIAVIITLASLSPSIAQAANKKPDGAKPTPAAKPDAPAPVPDGLDSRYIFVPPIDDHGKTSGSHALTICLPAGYEPTDRRYTVFYLLDGENAFLTSRHGMTETIAYELAADQLVHDGLIDPVIFVAVHNSIGKDGRPVPGNRGTDYNPSHLEADGGKAAGFYDFLTRTVKPMIDRKYRTLPGPASTGIAGFSAGGHGAFWMTYEHPETFGMALVESGGSVKFLDGYKGPAVPPVRLWIDAGSKELGRGFYKTCYDLSRRLVGLGFRQDDNLAFYIGHDQGHEKSDCNKRMRAALYFLLRKKAPQPTGAAICEVNTLGDDGPIRLARTGYIDLECIYEHGFRIADCTAKFTIADPSLVAFDEATNQLRPLAAGHTTITATFQGRQVVQQLEVPPREAPLPCPVAAHPITVDGDLSDWPELPCKVDAPLRSEDAPEWKSPADLSYRFGCMHDDQFLYIAIQTTDDSLVSDPAKDPWAQDGVEVRVDARPSAQRFSGPGEAADTDLLLVAMSPASAGETRPPYKAAILPPGTKAICVATPTGHNTELAIPVAYLNEKAGKDWTDIRINIVVDDRDKDHPKDFAGNKLWWRPDWRSAADQWESGTFKRTPAAAVH